MNDRMGKLSGWVFRNNHGLVNMCADRMVHFQKYKRGVVQNTLIVSSIISIVWANTAGAQLPRSGLSANVLLELSLRVESLYDAGSKAAAEYAKSFQEQLPQKHQRLFRLWGVLWAAESFARNNRPLDAFHLLKQSKEDWVAEANCLLPMRARVFQLIRKYEDSLADLSLARKQGYTSLDDDLLFALLQHDLVSPEQSLATLREIVGVYPHSYEAWSVFGDVSRLNGTLEEALKAYNEALVISPNSADALNSRGYVYARLGKLDLALDDLDRAVFLNTKSVAARLDRAGVHLLMGDPDSASDDLDSADAIDPALAEYGGASIYRAKVALMKGDSQSARRHASRAQEFPSAFDSVLVDSSFFQQLLKSAE